MDFVFDDFRQTIDELARCRMLNDTTRLVLHGRIQYAAERGDLTILQANELFALLGDEFLQRFRRELQVAAQGKAEVVA